MAPSDPFVPSVCIPSSSIPPSAPISLRASTPPACRPSMPLTVRPPRPLGQGPTPLFSPSYLLAPGAVCSASRSLTLPCARSRADRGLTSAPPCIFAPLPVGNAPVCRRAVLGAGDGHWARRLPVPRRRGVAPGGAAHGRRMPPGRLLLRHCFAILRRVPQQCMCPRCAPLGRADVP